MRHHNWQDSEMISTLEIARLAPQLWPREISRLTQHINRTTDPHMDENRVRTAVNAACNALAGNPDAFPKASARLRRLVAIGKGKGKGKE